jgi:hypothetical protein
MSRDVHSRARDGIQSRLPSTKVGFGVLKDLSRVELMVICLACIAGHDRAVVDVVEQATGVSSKNDLLLRTLDDRGGVNIKGLLELCPGLPHNTH